MYLRKSQAGNAPGYRWEHDGQVIEVHDELAWELLNIPHGGFSEAEPPKAEPVEEDPETEPENTQEPADDDEPSKPKRGRPKKTEISE
jgi:hypothetical protein